MALDGDPGFQTIFVNDVWDTSLETLKKNNPKLNNKQIICEDINELCKRDLLKEYSFNKSDLDVLIGGVVCKGFSLAGVRNPYDFRNYLYISQLKLVEQFMPKVSIIENVPGMKTMKIFLISTLFCLLIIPSLFSQEKEYKATMQGWEVDLNVAYKLSKEKKLPILANFTGSDWCGWCIRLKNSVFITEEFKKWAAKNVILLEVDFPRRSKLPDNIAQQNNGLKQAFKIAGYPTVWVFDIDLDKKTGKTNLMGLAKTGYMASAADFIKALETTMEANRKKMKQNKPAE